MSALTVLLIPPAGDAALLADEPGGGRVPTVTVIRCQIHGHAVRLPARGDHPGSALGYICPGCFEAKLGDDEWGDIRFEPPMLALAIDGAPVAMACDRAMRWCRNHPDREKTGIYWPQPRANWTMGLAKDLADFVARLGARVVLLRDGREVPNV